MEVVEVSDIPQPLNIDMVGRALAAAGFTEFHITHEAVTDYKFTIRRTYKDKFDATADLGELRKQFAVQLEAVHGPAQAKKLADKLLIIPYETAHEYSLRMMELAGSVSYGGHGMIDR
ncbi:hypothetical protein [Pseudomonas sp. TWP3-1]|uniref:hypothetical protein n=1 Tax=Pseudomonas sp. TWP3-1 TaxID=2804631 RepID=UPI003CE99C1C